MIFLLQLLINSVLTIQKIRQRYWLAKLKKVVDDKSKYTDWAKRDDIKAELKMDLILILAEYGYPPVTNDEVFKEIFEQAENFKKYND